MAREGGFTLLEIVLVILLLGITGSLVMLNFPADRGLLARQGERLSWLLTDGLDRAEREGAPYGVAFGRRGWRHDDSYTLPAGIELELRLEQQVAPLAAEPDAEPQIWLYPGGETTAFSVILQQGACRWTLRAPGYFVFESAEIECDENEK